MILPQTRMRMNKMYARPCASIEESGSETIAKIIVVQGKGRACGDGIEMKRWMIAKQIGVAVSLMTRMFMLLTRARTSVGMSVSGR